MSTAFYSATSYKPQVLSRTEGFHLPSPAPSTPPSADSTPSGSSNNGTGSNNNNNNNGGNPSSFDTHNLFITPPSYLSVPETFRKFPGPSPDNGSSMDFTEELASLISNPATSGSSGHHHHHPSSHERSTQSPANAYDDYRPHTHNIFDISAPTQHHSHHSSHHQQQQQPHSPYGPGPGSSAFSLPPTSAMHHGSLHGSHHSQQSSHHGGSLHNHNSHPLHDFAPHSHFNSTVPAIGASMRYEPPGSSHGPPPPGGEPSSVSSFNSHISGISSLSNFSNMTTTSEAYHQANGHMRQTPSPVSAQPEFSTHRSRSRSRGGSGNGNSSNGAGAGDPANPPSTNGGPTRRTRAKRNNSVSSVSPPPLQRHTQPLLIPGSNGASNGVNGNGARGPASPLSLHTNGWFIPTSSSQQGGEFSLPTPESVHGGFSGFPNTLNISPKDVNGLVLNNVVGMAGTTGGVTTVSMKGESPPGDMATKQALLANEKRRRRRESHNAVERRRRDNINEKISELATLIPEWEETSLLSPMEAGFEEDEKDGGSTGKEGGKEKDGKDGKDGAGVKANKGMILRKSVEYIRYLQQLVTAQASRNRDLEQQLQTYRNGGVPPASPSNGTPSGPIGVNGLTPLITGSNASMNGNAKGEDDMGLLLHDEVDLHLPNIATSTSSTSPSSTSTSTTTTATSPSVGGSAHRRTHSSTRKFNGFELESVEEMDMEDDAYTHTSSHPQHAPHGHPKVASTAAAVFVSRLDSGDDGDEQEHDEDMDRPSTVGGMSMSMSMSPSGSGSPSGDEHGDEHEQEDGEGEERGRRIGRTMGQQPLDVKVKEETGMEMS